MVNLTVPEFTDFTGGYLYISAFWTFLSRSRLVLCAIQVKLFDSINQMTESNWSKYSLWQSRDSFVDSCEIYQM